jgi:hypothetical protein
LSGGCLISTGITPTFEDSIMRTTLAVFLLASLALLGACRNGSTVVDTGSRSGGEKVPAGQIVLLEHEYSNYAWGYQHHGIVVTGEGNVLRYEWARGDRPWTLSEGPTMTGAELIEKYDHNQTHLGVVGADTLELVAGLLAAAERGELSEKESRGADMGQTTRTAYRFDAGTQLYTPILLRTDGDWTWHNKAPEAARLAEIIDAIAARYQ